MTIEQTFNCQEDEIMRKTFKMEVDCANCAARIEEAIQKIDGVHSVRVNFMTQKLVLDADDARFDDIVKQAAKAARKVDSESCIIL